MTRWPKTRAPDMGLDIVTDLILQALEAAEAEKLEQSSRELSLVITKLEEAAMWRERDLQLKA